MTDPLHQSLIRGRGAPASGAMEAGGAYNRHAKLQERASASALPLWEKAARSIPLARTDEPVVIADYGSSQGRNSLLPMRLATETLRVRLGEDRPILVCHIDLAINDFNALFALLDGEPGCYAKGQRNVFACAVGRSFYQEVLPPSHAHLGWSSYAANWISRIPTALPGHIYVPCSSGAERAAFERQSAQDWEAFLSLRARELRPGGRLVVVVPGADEEGWGGFEPIMDHANAVLADMVADRAITADERERMVLGVWPRQRRELLAPFADDGQFRDLVLESCETAALADAAWADYQRDGDEKALASTQAAYYRATFAPSLASALGRAQDAEACRAFSDRLEQGLRQRLMADPAPIDSFVETAVFAKLDR